MKPEDRESLVLTVPNFHIPQSGQPPSLVAGGRYTAYFENGYGEQLVFTYDWKEHKGTLWHGDLSWESPREVLDGVCPRIILNRQEQQWLLLCWEVATEHEPEEIKLKSALALAQAEVASYESLAATESFREAERYQHYFARQKRYWRRREKEVERRLENLRAVTEAERIARGEPNET